MQASVGWLTLPLKSSLIASNLRDFETVVKTPASILISPARAVSTRMSELEEGGAMWEDDGIPGFLHIPQEYHKLCPCYLLLRNYMLNWLTMYQHPLTIVLFS